MGGFGSEIFDGGWVRTVSGYEWWVGVNGKWIGVVGGCVGTVGGCEQ